MIVKPPAFASPGMCTSSHWPGRNYTVGIGRQRDVWTYDRDEDACLDGLVGCAFAELDQAHGRVHLLYAVENNVMDAGLSTVACCAFLVRELAHYGLHAAGG